MSVPGMADVTSTGGPCFSVWSLREMGILQPTPGPHRDCTLMNKCLELEYSLTSDHWALLAFHLSLCHFPAMETYYLAEGCLGCQRSGDGVFPGCHGEACPHPAPMLTCPVATLENFVPVAVGADPEGLGQGIPGLLRGSAAPWEFLGLGRLHTVSPVVSSRRRWV